MEGAKYVTVFSPSYIVSAVSKHFEGMSKERSFTQNIKISNNYSSYYGDDDLGAEGYLLMHKQQACVVTSSLLFL